MLQYFNTSVYKNTLFSPDQALLNTSKQLDSLSGLTECHWCTYLLHCKQNFVIYRSPKHIWLKKKNFEKVLLVSGFLLYMCDKLDFEHWLPATGWVWKALDVGNFSTAQDCYRRGQASFHNNGKEKYFNIQTTSVCLFKRFWVPESQYVWLFYL